MVAEVMTTVPHTSVVHPGALEVPEAVAAFSATPTGGVVDVAGEISASGPTFINRYVPQSETKKGQHLAGHSRNFITLYSNRIAFTLR